MEMMSLWPCIYLIVVVYSLLAYSSTKYSYDILIGPLMTILSIVLFWGSLVLLFLMLHTSFHYVVLVFIFLYSFVVYNFRRSDTKKFSLIAESIVYWVSIPIAIIFALLLGMSISQFPIAL